jgi:hypothetical protein
MKDDVSTTAATTIAATVKALPTRTPAKKYRFRNFIFPLPLQTLPGQRLGDAAPG